MPDLSPLSAASPFVSTHETLDAAILRVLMDVLPDHIYFKDLESRFVRNNWAHARSLGANSPDDCVGKTDFDFFARDHAEKAFKDEKEIMQSGRAIIGQVEHLTRLDGTVFWGSATKMVWRDKSGVVLGTCGITRNITAIKEAEEKLTNERNLLRTIIDHLPSRIFVKDRDARFIINNRAHLESLGLGTQDESRGKTTFDFFANERGRQALSDDRAVLESGQAMINQEKSDFASGAPRWSLTTKVPLTDARGEIVGLVGISHDITERKRVEQELKQRTEVMEADLHVARQIQDSFFPNQYPVFPRGVPPEASELRFAHKYVPATTLGGDFFDIIQLSDTRCGVVICDVMGHGVRAGLLTALIRGVVEESAIRTSHPGEVLNEINRALMPIVNQTGQPIFATAFFAFIDTSDASMAYANAGHPPPLIVHAGREPRRLELQVPEPAAGLVEDFLFTSLTTSFEPGDVFLGYTDGVIEAGNPMDDMYGEKRLLAYVLANAHRNGPELLDGLVADLVAFTGTNVFSDDVCTLTIASTGASCAMRPALNYEI